MKKRVLIFTTVFILILSLALAFAGCDKLKDLGAPKPEEGGKSITLIVGEETYSVYTTAEYLHDLLCELDEKGTIEYKYDDSGAYLAITKVNELVTTPDWSKYVAIYLDSEDPLYVGFTGDVTVSGKTYHYANLGAESLPVLDGVTYVLLQGTY